MRSWKTLQTWPSAMIMKEELYRLFRLRDISEAMSA